MLGEYEFSAHAWYNSHVARTGDIKNFVIMEESGIAKGIRRIVAVTGNEARDATRFAETLVCELDTLEHFSGKEIEARLKALGVVRMFGFVSAGDINYVFTNRNLARQIYRSSRKPN